MKASKLALVVSILLNGVLGFLLMTQRARNAGALGQAEALRVELEQLKGNVAELQSKQVNDAELERLKADQREAIKLRGEVGNLKSAVAAANAARTAAEKSQASAAARANAATQTKTEPEQTPYTRVFNAKTQAVMPSGNAVIIGGWEANPGKRTFGFVVPTTDPNNPNAVMLETKWVEISTNALANIPANMITPDQNQPSVLGPTQFGILMKAFENAQGVDILSSPKVTTASGRQASVVVTQRRNTPDGNAAEFGPTMNLLPTIDPSDGTITVAVDATMTLPSAELLKASENEEKK